MNELPGIRSLVEDVGFFQTGDFCFVRLGIFGHCFRWVWLSGVCVDLLGPFEFGGLPGFCAISFGEPSAAPVRLGQSSTGDRKGRSNKGCDKKVLRFDFAICTR